MGALMRITLPPRRHLAEPSSCQALLGGWRSLATPPSGSAPPRARRRARRTRAARRSWAAWPASEAPRQVVASRPSTAQRAGITSVTFCSQAGNTNEGTQAPPSITINSTARMATPRVAGGVLPSAAISSPKVEAISAVATHTARKASQLPSTRMPKTIIPNANVTPRTMRAMSAPLVPLAGEQDAAREGRGAQALPQPLLPLEEHADGEVDAGEQEELDPHPREGVGEAVVGDARAHGDRLLVRGVRHGETRGPPPGEAPGAGEAGLALVPAVHRAQHVGQRPPVAVGHACRRLAASASACCVSRRPWSPPNISALTACITCCGEDAAHHGQLGAVRGVVEELELRLGRAAEEGLPRRVPEARGHHHRHRRLAAVGPPRATRRRCLPRPRAVLSAERPCTIALEMTLRSWSTTRTGTRAVSALWLPEKMKPKNEAMAMGAAKLMITARRSVKNSSRSLRTMARHAWSAISPSGCGR